MAEFKISKFSSLSFYHNWKASFQMNEQYIQRFSTSDEIRIQYTVPSWGSFTVILVSHANNSISSITPVLVDTVNTEGVITYTYEVLLPVLEIGRYTLEIRSFGRLADRSCFCILPDEELENTVLFTYTHRRNEYDAVFVDDNEEFTFFQWRVEGGFIPFESSFLVDSEFFRDQRASITQLSAFPYKTQTLTLGAELGVPVWCAEKVNLVLSLSTILVNDTAYVRSEGATPQLTELLPFYPLYVYKIDLEENENYSETQGIPKIKVLGTEQRNILGTESIKGIEIN